MLEIVKLSSKIEEKQIIDNLSLAISPGEVVAIMGPNGSGKSTLANSLIGNPRYEVSGKIVVDGKRIDGMSVDERAREGIFLANQYPMAVTGLNSTSFLWQIYKKRNLNDKNISNVIEFRKWLEKQAELLGLNKDLLKRGLNDGFSGGEKKKLEILQMLVFNPKYVILDEIDSGLDVDALKKLAKTVAMVAKKMNIGVLVITHYNRILKYLVADRVVILNKGIIEREGGPELAVEVEDKGYQSHE